MTSFYYIRGPVKGLEHPDDALLDGPVIDEFVATAISKEAALEKHQTHCEELGIELEETTVEVLDDYLEEGEQLFGVEDTIWQPGDSIGEAQRERLVESLTHIHTGIMSTIHEMNTGSDDPVSMNRIVERYESTRDQQLDRSKIDGLFDELVDGDFIEQEQEDGMTVYSLPPERVRELRRASLKDARLYEWAGRNLSGDIDE